MAQKTDLNVSPYFDDFSETDNFNRVLFRPGFAIQARELTQLQSVLQNQIEQGFSHMFKDGTVVIPGQSGYLGGKNAARYVRIQSSFGGETIVEADWKVVFWGENVKKTENFPVDQHPPARTTALETTR